MEKGFVIVSMLMIAGGLHLAHAGNADRGRVLFESPTLGGGTTGKSCMTCHQGGKGLGSDLFERKNFTIMGMDKEDLADVVNVCIEKPLGGTGLDPEGEEMKDLMAYMKALVDPPARK